MVKEPVIVLESDRGLMMPSRQTSVYEKGKNASISDFVPDQLSKQSSGRTVSFSTSHRDPSSPKPEVDTLVFEGRRPWPKFHRKTTFSSGRVCWVDDTEISKVPGGERDQISRRCQPNEEHGKLKEANFLIGERERDRTSSLVQLYPSLESHARLALNPSRKIGT